MSVVICAYTLSRFALLADAVSSVESQVTPAREIIVVIDHNEELLSRARSEFRGVCVLPSSEIRGYPGARNTGARAAKGALVAFLDDDAVAAPDWIKMLQLALSENNVLGGGGAVLARWPSGKPPRWFPEEYLWVVGCSYRGLPSTLTCVRNPIGANMAIKRYVLEELGGFRLDMGPVEETEFCVRASQRWPTDKWILSPDPRVDHVVLPERCRPRYFMWRCYREGLAKAKLDSYVGRQDALTSERIYVRKVLPAAVARGIKEAAQGDPWGLARSTGVVAGLGAAGVGFLRGRLEARAGVRFTKGRRYAYGRDAN